MKAVTLQIPAVVLKWVRMLAQANNFDDLEDYLVHAIVDNLKMWLDFDNDNNEMHAQLAIRSMFDDGLFDVFPAYKVDLPMDDCLKELVERSKTPQAEAKLPAS